jgi:argininosuccinate lyase
MRQDDHRGRGTGAGRTGRIDRTARTARPGPEAGPARGPRRGLSAAPTGKASREEVEERRKAAEAAKAADAARKEPQADGGEAGGRAKAAPKAVPKTAPKAPKTAPKAPEAAKTAKAAKDPKTAKAAKAPEAAATAPESPEAGPKAPEEAKAAKASKSRQRPPDPRVRDLMDIHRRAGKRIDPWSVLPAEADPEAEGDPARSSKPVIQGRLAGRTDPALMAASVSVDFDRELALHDIRGSRAHAEMLRQSGLLTAEEAADIRRGLEKLKVEISKGRLKWEPALEDVHMNIERALTDLIGPAGAKLHTARSRNDQVALDERLYLIEACDRFRRSLWTLRVVLVERAANAGHNPMPGYTHLQRAQPVLIAHHLLAYYHMLSRDADRLFDLTARLPVLPSGSGALAGTGLPVRVDLMADSLGFGSLASNSLDAVASRDLILEFLSFGAITMVHLSRLAEDVVLWCSQEFGFATLPDSLTTSSSMMPHKRNPDGAELIRGKAGRTIGNLVSLLTTIKGLPLSYNRDLQEDKEPLFDTVATLDKVLPLAARIVEELSFDFQRTRAAADDPYTPATDLADHLVLKGVSFREAHERVGRLVAKAAAEGRAMRDLTDGEVAVYCPEADPGVVRTLTLDRLLDARCTTPGGTAPAMVDRRIVDARMSLIMEAEEFDVADRRGSRR